MLRWCQSTFRNLDGHGRKYASTARRVLPRVAALAEDTPSFRQYSDNATHSDSWNHCVTPLGRSSIGLRKIRPTSIRRRNGMLENISREISSHAPQKVGLEDTKTSSIDNSLNSAKRVSGHPPNVPKVSSVSVPTTTTDIVAMLRDVLSRGGEIKKHSILSILSMYDTIPKESKLSTLGQTGLTDIISFCGSLASLKQSKYDNPLAPRFKGLLPRSQIWAFVAKVGAEKVNLGYDLNLQDRYWMMQSFLARLRSLRKGNLHLEIPEMDALFMQYEQFQGMSDEPDDHFPYLKFLASSNNPSYVAEAVKTLFNLLDRIPDPRIPEFLRDIVLSSDKRVPDNLKETISRTIFYRLDRDLRPSISTFSGVIAAAPSTPAVDHSGIIGIAHLSAALAASVFPCYSFHHPIQPLARWAVQQAHQAFATHLPLDIRWRNTVLLAASISPKNFDVEDKCDLSSKPSLESCNALWRTTLLLENVVQRSQCIKTVSLAREIQGVTRPLWKAFLTAGIENQPIDITRAYVSTFLQIAANSYDRTLKGECYHLSQQLGLWKISPTHPWTTKAQATDFVAAYAQAYIACEGRDWRSLDRIISASLSDSPWQPELTNILIPRFSLQNVETAYDLYIHALETGIDVSQHVLAGLLSELVRQERWDITSMFLEHPSTTPGHLQLLFSESLFIFHSEQRRCANAAYVRLLAQTAFRLYEDQPPPQSLKYPVRYFLSIMVWSHNSSGMVKLVQLFHRTVPNFFTDRLVRGLVLHLVRRRDIPNAFKLLRIFHGANDKAPSRSLEDIRRKMMFSLFKKGAHNAARRLARGKNQIQSLARRDALVHVGLSPFPSPTADYRHILRIVSQAKSDGPTIREAVSLLLQAKRSLSARKLYAQSRSKLDLKTSTVIGNMILHSPMNHKEFRYARLVRRVIKAKDALVKAYGFSPDRTTLNIIIKSILRWTTMVDAPKVRRLFDNMIHEGYPVPLRFRRAHGVPFSSPHGPFQALSIASLPPNISFSRHIRPMYKMFIKAFYVRNDVVAAKTVVGILKEIEFLEMRELEKRNRARRDGVIKKRMKESRQAEGAVSNRGNTKSA